MTRGGNLVDQFKKAPSAPAAATVTSAKSSSLSSATVHQKATVGQWFQKNWGKAAAIFIVVIITTIFIVRTVLIAKNKKKARAGAAPAALNQSVEWESFLANEPPVPPPHMRHMPPPPHMMQQMPPMPVRLPQQVPPHVAPQVQPHQVQQPQPVIERGLHQQRLPPADGATGGAGLIPSMMPQSSRPQNVTFTIDSAPPVMAAPEKDEPKKLDGEEAQLMPPDVDAPSAGTEFNR